MTRGARGYSWPTFERGNVVALHHGAYSARTWRPLADRLAEQLVDVAPWTARDTFAPTVAAWARTEAQIVLVMDYLDQHGPLDADGEERSAATLLQKLEKTASNLRAALGLDPSSLARLLKDVSTVASTAVEGTGLEALAAEGRAIRQEAERRHALAAANGAGSGAQVPQEPLNGSAAVDHATRAADSATAGDAEGAQ